MAIAYDIKVALRDLIKERVGPNIEVSISRPKDNINKFISIGDVSSETETAAMVRGAGKFEYNYYYDLDIGSGESTDPEDAEQSVWQLFDIVAEVIEKNPSLGIPATVRFTRPFATETISGWNDSDKFMFVIQATIHINVWKPS